MVKNCRRCGVLFNSEKEGRLCVSCIKEDDEVFLKVKEFIYENPRATISEVASTLQLTVNRIKRYLREGRLEIIEKHNLFLECENCGVSIQSGRFCTICTNEFFNDLKNSENSQMKKKAENEIESIKFLYSPNKNR